MDKKLLLHIIIGMILICAGALTCQNARPPVPPKTPQELLDTLVHMDPQKHLMFSEFPEALEDMKYMHAGIIFITPKKDTVELITKFPNPSDKKNRFNTYFIKHYNGNVCHYWWMYQDEEDYIIYKENWFAGLLKEMTFKERGQE